MSSLDSNIQQVNAVFNALKNKVKPSRKLMLPISEELHASVMNNFSTQGSLVPGGWPALKPSTIKQKRKKGFSEKMLEARGLLERSIQSSATDYVASAHTNLRYAAIHNFGGSIHIGGRTKTLFHRTDKSGNLLKQESNKNLLLFAKKSHKQKSAYTFGQKAYTVTIPARPFMVLTESYRNNITEIIRKHVINP